MNLRWHIKCSSHMKTENQYILTALWRLAFSLYSSLENASANTARTNRLMTKDTNNAMPEENNKTIYQNAAIPVQNVCVKKNMITCT